MSTNMISLAAVHGTLSHLSVCVLQAVAALAQHRATEAASISREEARNAAAAAHKQQLAAVQLEAEQRANKLMKEASCQVSSSWFNST